MKLVGEDCCRLALGHGENHREPRQVSINVFSQGGVADFRQPDSRRKTFPFFIGSQLEAPTMGFGHQGADRKPQTSLPAVFG